MYQVVHQKSQSSKNETTQSTTQYTEKELTFTSKGNRIYGRVLLPDTSGKVPTVILSHGFGGNHEQELTLQQRLAENGIAVYSFDFSGGTGYEPGQSEGKMTDMSVLTEKQNLEDAISMISKQNFVDTAQLYLIGASQGGVVSTLVANEQVQNIKGLFLLYPALSLFDDARERFASKSDIPNTYDLMGLTVGRKYFEDVYDMDIYNYMDNFKNPVYIFHGTSDSLVPVTYSERAQKTFANAQLTTLSGEGHGFSNDAQEKIASAIIKSIKKS